MNPLLRFILQTTLVGSITTIFFLLLHPLRQKILNAGWHYLLIKILGLFFILPVGVISSLRSLWQKGSAVVSVIPVEQAVQPAVNEAVPLGQEIVAPLIQPLNSTLSNALRTSLWGKALFFIWFLGTVGFILHQGLSYLKFYRNTMQYSRSLGSHLAAETKLCNNIARQMGIRRKITVVINPKVTGPMVFFGKANTVVLPAKPVSESDLKYVFYHELIHIKRHDLKVKFLFLCVCAVHWFNPLCHILFRQLNTWCELSCDERVIKNLSHTEKKEYGLSIINLMYSGKSTEKLLCSSYSCNKKALKRRLNMLIKEKRYMKTKIALSLVLTLFVGTVAASAGTAASNLLVSKPSILNFEPSPGVTVLESSERMGTPLVIQYNGKQYKTVDERFIQLRESSDSGQTWHEFAADYETTKFLFENLGVDIHTYDSYLAQITETIAMYEIMKRSQPENSENYQANIEMWESMLPVFENKEVLSSEDFFMLINRKEYTYEYSQTQRFTDGTEGDIVGVGGVGYTIEELFESLASSLQYSLSQGYLTPEDTNAIWLQCLEEYNLTEHLKDRMAEFALDPEDYFA